MSERPPSSEARLLLAAARIDRNEQPVGLHHHAAAPVAWSRAVRLAHEHGLAPLLHHHLVREGLLERVPEEPRAWLTRWAHAAALRAVKLRAELRVLLEAAAAEGVRLLPLKGAALAERVYGSWALRPMVDLDLLVPAGQWARAETLLTRLGYTLALPNPHAREGWRRLHCHLRFTRPGGPAPVELHWQLAPARHTSYGGLPADEVWSRVFAAPVVGIPAFAMTAEDELLFLALHHARHGYQSLLGFVDLSEVIRHSTPNLCWETVVRRAHETATPRRIGYLLWWTREYLAAPVPPAVMECLCDRPAEIDLRLGGIEGLLVSPVGNRWAVLRRELAFVAGSRQRLRCAWRSLLPSADAVALSVETGGSWWRTGCYLLGAPRWRRAFVAARHYRR